jgi:hypothetical protein
MTGTITKKHFFKIAKEFGIRKAIRILLTKDKTALIILMMGE